MRCAGERLLGWNDASGAVLTLLLSRRYRRQNAAESMSEDKYEDDEEYYVEGRQLGNQFYGLHYTRLARPGNILTDVLLWAVRGN